MIHKEQFDLVGEKIAPAINILNADGIVTNISVYLPDGQIIHSMVGNPPSHTNSTLFRTAYESGKPQGGLEFAETGQLVTRSVFPLYRRAKPIAYISYDSSLEGAIAQYKLAAGVDVTILDKNGSTLYSTDEDLTRRLTLTPPLNVDFAQGVLEADKQLFSYEIVPARSQDDKTLAYVANLFNDTQSIWNNAPSTSHHLQ